MQFVKEYNERTQNQRGQIVPVEITIYEDRTFSFITKTPPAADLIKKAIGIEQGSNDPKTIKVGSIPMSKVREIAEIKMKDLNANDLDAAAKIIAGTARSMGVEVEA
jgi:large subunit ribosomal protein L11